MNEENFSDIFVLDNSDPQNQKLALVKGYGLVFKQKILELTGKRWKRLMKSYMFHICTYRKKDFFGSKKSHWLQVYAIHEMLHVIMQKDLQIFS